MECSTIWSPSKQARALKISTFDFKPIDRALIFITQTHEIVIVEMRQNIAKKSFKSKIYN